uniref:NADH dehydrogenase subunit 4L n=1 Tax=Megalophaedusa sugimotonis sugimotonis TaxID=1885722 RepID=A0A224AAR7_9EUPU|nr:NADH dehydrogenase subunit 4L [Megalophaedusa sugimotonis sugimotonis]
MWLLYLLSLQMATLILLFFSSQSLYLNALLILESVVLSSLVLSLFILSASMGNLYIFMLLLTFGVCEAGLGLSLLMSYIKITGNNYIMPMF